MRQVNFNSSVRFLARLASLGLLYGLGFKSAERRKFISPRMRRSALRGTIFARRRYFATYFRSGERVLRRRQVLARFSFARRGILITKILSDASRNFSGVFAAVWNFIRRRIFVGRNFKYHSPKRGGLARIKRICDRRALCAVKCRQAR